MNINSEVKISIRDLQVGARIGIYEKERLENQPLIIDADITFDATKSMKSDNIEDTIDYFELSKEITKIVKGSNFKLLEKLLNHLLELVMSIPKAKEAKITIRKPKALEKFGAMVSVSGESST